MQPFDVKGVVAHLVARPVRPRYQDRTMEASFIAQDEFFAQSRLDRHGALAERFDRLATNISISTSGSVEMLKGPIVVCSLILLTIGATTIFR